MWWQQQIELFGEFILWIVSISSILMPKIRAYKFDVPKKNEETEIIRLLAKEQQSKEVAEKVLEQIDLIKKAILRCALRGELSTNDLSEESPVELLKNVMSN